MNEEELKELQSKALSQFKSGKPLFGKGGAFAPMLKQFLETALEADMEEHLSETEIELGNQRNGKGRKTIKSSRGSIELKLVYRADTKDIAELELDNLAEKWEKKYPVVIKSW